MRLFLIVYVCIKCGLMQQMAPPIPCSRCHGPTVKEWLDDDYIAD